MSSNISVIGKDICCGCTACYASCPVGAISMVPDYEGFLYPEVDNVKCILCGKCVRVCSDIRFNKEHQVVYASRSSDVVRSRSSSGGVFSILAKKVLKENGVVCAVGYSDDYKECLHKIIYSEEQLDDLRRAKFIQSKKYDIYSQVEKELKQGRFTLFCGTPCEVGGLHQFLLWREYDNLLTCDLICGCVSSPEVYRRYIEFLSAEHGAAVTSVNFKDKRKGWRGKAISVTFKNGDEYYNSILEDDYCVSFHSRYNIRPSCFNCKYRNLRRVSDITLGDFWAIEKYDRSLDDNKGTSFVLINTLKGKGVFEALEGLESRLMEISLEDYCSKYNWCMFRNPDRKAEQDRRRFYNDVYTMRFDEMALKDLAQIKEFRKQQKIKQFSNN